MSGTAHARKSPQKSHGQVFSGQVRADSESCTVRKSPVKATVQSRSPKKTHHFPSKTHNPVKHGKHFPDKRRHEELVSDEMRNFVMSDSGAEDGDTTSHKGKRPDSCDTWHIIEVLCKEFGLMEKQARVCLWRNSGDVRATRFWILTGQTLPGHWVWLREEDTVLQTCEPSHPDWQCLENTRGLQAVLARQRFLMGTGDV